jgi:uncharacterized protein YodC (DUF2158 family)
VPSNATGIDWEGSVSGQGTSKTTATTAGTYQARVRAYLTAGGTTCYSGYSSYTSATVYPPLDPGSLTSATTTICEGGTVAAISPSAPSGGHGTYTCQWKQGTGPATGAANTNTFTPAGTYLTTAGTYKFTRTVTSCGATSTTPGTFTLIVIATPDAPAASSPQTFCSSANPTVANLTATGTDIRWYTVASSGSSLSTTTALANNTTYYASQTTNGCESTRKAVTVTISACVTGCTGLQLYQTTSSADGNGNWSTANSYCTSKGARLPTLTELECMCSNKANLTGGYVSGFYWSSAQDGISNYLLVDFDSCLTYSADSKHSFYFRCVL